jgi:hypothetical protein
MSKLSHDFLPHALFEKRSLIRSWLMRDTVHIIPASSLGLYRAALKRPLMNEWNRWTVKTARAREMSLQGLLCHATSSGPWYHNTQHSFARVDGWLPRLAGEPLEENEALRELARRYLRSNGPATVSDFAYWSGMRIRDARPAFEGISELTKEVSISGQRGRYLVLEEDAAKLRISRDLPSHVRLLPQFDALIMGHRDKSRFMISDDKKSIFLPRANVAATILIDGRVEGVWKMRKKKKQWALELSPFRVLSNEEDEALGKEIEEFRRFTGFEIVVDMKPVVA